VALPGSRDATLARGAHHSCVLYRRRADDVRTGWWAESAIRCNDSCVCRTKRPEVLRVDLANPADSAPPYCASRGRSGCQRQPRRVGSRATTWHLPDQGMRRWLAEPTILAFSTAVGQTMFAPDGGLNQRSGATIPAFVGRSVPKSSASASPIPLIQRHPTVLRVGGRSANGKALLKSSGTAWRLRTRDAGTAVVPMGVPIGGTALPTASRGSV
jgi:hypothetical protein